MIKSEYSYVRSESHGHSVMVARPASLELLWLINSKAELVLRFADVLACD